MGGCLPDDIQFGTVREKVFSIISREDLKNKVTPPKKKSPQETDFYWKVVDSIGKKLAIHLRPLVMMLDFSSTIPNNPWIEAIAWIKELVEKNKELARQSIDDCPEKTVPKS